MKSARLLGSKSEQIYQMLKLAGWYEDRKVDITEVEKYYEINNLNMYESVKSFFKAFYKITEYWYINGEDSKQAPYFEFCLFPWTETSISIKDYMFDDEEYKIPSHDYQSVQAFAKEDCVMVGTIGYYYPARVWIDKRGNFYAMHEYDEKVYRFSSIFELIEHELSHIEIKTVAIPIKKN